MESHITLQVTERDLLYLRSHWRLLADPYGAGGEAAGGWFGLLACHYSEPERHYHNLHHVAEMLRLLEPFEASARDYDAVRFAAWFHDAVYDTRSKSNEEESAALAGRALWELGVPRERVDAARRLILATKGHDGERGLPDLGLFLDADLSILGAPEEIYLAYSGAIRKEYAWVPDAAYREGRVKVLSKFLGRGRLYHTDRLAERFESRARSNLRNEIRRLSAYAEPGSL